MSETVLITGSNGLIGSEAVRFFDRAGWRVVGVDNNQRQDFFGPDGDTSSTLAQLRRTMRSFDPRNLDLRDRPGVLDLVCDVKPAVVIHCAAQPSHDLARQRPFEDFDINASATLTLLEAVRRFTPRSPFIFMSTNKVYGSAPNEKPMRELETRWDYTHAEDAQGIDETCRIDASLHSLFGVSKTAADLLVQEYGRTFDIPTVCFRGGCLTGPHHAGAEAHGFLAYLAKCVREGRPYRIYGWKGKQVRDNLHAYDVCNAFWAFLQRPRAAAVYNLGGGRSNSISVLEAVQAFERRTGRTLSVELVDDPRLGDHQCYISNLQRFQHDYPSWSVTRSLDTILDELAAPISSNAAFDSTQT